MKVIYSLWVSEKGDYSALFGLTILHRFIADANDLKRPKNIRQYSIKLPTIQERHSTG